jgi:stage II sporulation protein P
MKKKGLTAAVLAVLCMRMATASGADEKLMTWIQDKAEGGQLITATLNVELGEAATPTPTLPPDPSPTITQQTTTPEPTSTVSPTSTLPPETSSGTQAGNIIPTTISGGVTIKNNTSFEVDIQALLAEGLNLTLAADAPQILIVHTHGSEAYTPDGTDQYEASGTSRTQDKEQSVIRVGDELAASLEACGLSVLHDREIYDYPSYTGSYTRSGEAIQSYLDTYPSISIVIDLHRDALGTGDVIYKTMAELPGQTSSQIMLLAGTGENGLSHPNWRENLKLALVMQSAACEKYPTLMRPVLLAQERYNQQLTTGSLIMEVGSAGNTLQEALCAVRLFAEAVGPKLAEYLA